MSRSSKKMSRQAVMNGEEEETAENNYYENY